MRCVGLLLVLGSCLTDTSVMCGELTCPKDTVCTEVGCRQQSQLDACVGKQDGDSCGLASSTGACVQRICEPIICGDRKIVPPEVCDDGNVNSGDGCSADCRSTGM